MIVEWRVEEDGTFGPIGRETVAKLRRRISQYKRGNRKFKIGITNNPVKRAARYDSDYPNRYHQMVVLYETGSHKRVGKLETMLICKYQDSDNEIGGGGGRKGEKKTAYYLYIVRSRPRKRGLRLPRVWR